MRRGDIMELGNHRLMCGDAGCPADVAALFEGRQADLIFTSPPYLQQRTYGKAIMCWDTLMQSVFGCLPAHESTQVLVNLGIVHRKGEWIPYWDGWIEWMRTQGWRRFGFYAWDKLEAMPGDHNGRLAPAFDLVWHFNKQRRYPNKTIPCKSAGTQWKRGIVMREANGMHSVRHGTRTVQPFKIADSILRIRSEKGPVRGLGHPAVFPIALPLAIHAAYTDPGELVYDPFAGSGTSILAAEQGGRVCYAMELEPSYCHIAIQRWEAWRAKGAPAS
jgi:DNA modification methylase